ncbi:hypothetical protein TL16_g12020 [Triparma laevis f. inornata]|uniref:Transmembrane protein n=2 Tax=Triparma laevis TaxID=1534972 RepID=A0A9W7BMQ1_9STRA|nr:hypothetical protein TL16_g12020 [Triparma laevis f. inornata]
MGMGMITIYFVGGDNFFEDVIVESFLTVMIFNNNREFKKTFVYALNAFVCLDVIKLGMYLGMFKFLGVGGYFSVFFVTSRVVLEIMCVWKVGKLLVESGEEDYVINETLEGLDLKNRVTVLGYNVLPVQESQIEVFGGTGRTLSSGLEVEAI